MKQLVYFVEQFDNKFTMIEEDISESTLESLYERGGKCIDKI